jgi:hypothetical protein
MSDGTAPTRPIMMFVEVLALSNIAFMQNHMHNFLRHSKHLDVQIASGVCAAIRRGDIHVGSDGSSRRFQRVLLRPPGAIGDRELYVLVFECLGA